jgi:hypothetical protein
LCIVLVENIGVAFVAPFCASLNICGTQRVVALECPIPSIVVVTLPLLMRIVERNSYVATVTTY